MPLETFASMIKNNDSKVMDDQPKGLRLGRNQMIWEFNFPVLGFDDPKAIQTKIDKLDKQFDLVLIAEHFDESMILLKDGLCWDRPDMMYVTLNEKSKSAKSVISEEARDVLRNWLNADYMLYNHFSEKFRKKVDNFGRERMLDEIRILSELREFEHKRCDIRRADNEAISDANKKWWGSNMIARRVNESDPLCRLYSLSGTGIQDLMRSLQTVRLCKTSSNDKIKAKYCPKKFINNPVSNKL